MGLAALCSCLGATRVRGTVLDPFGGAGTTGLVADRLQRDAILVELNPAYADIAERRIIADKHKRDNPEPKRKRPKIVDAIVTPSAQ